MKVAIVALVALVVLAAAAPARAELVATGYLDNNVAGDVQNGRPGVGASVGYYLHGRIGIELDGTTDRPDGSTYHITWSLGPGREAHESNDVLRDR